MKRLFIIISLMGILTYSNAQKVKTKRNETLMTIEEFKVLKSDKKIRNGSYIKKLKYGQTIIVKGQYLDNIKTGIWDYFDYRTGELEQKYDYDNKILLSSYFKSPDQANIYYKGDWLVANIDTMPIPIGGMSGLWIKIIETVNELTRPGVLPKDGAAVFSFVVTADGNNKDFKILKSSGNKFDDEILNIVKEHSFRWIPGIYKGDSVDTEFLIPMHIIYTKNTETVKSYIVSFRTLELK